MSLGKILLVGGNYDYIRMYRNLGFTGTYDINEADIVAFTGGEDVDPGLYGEMKLTNTHINRARDDVEMRIFEEAKARKLPMVGICRGGQFLNVMNDGKMWQDVNNHGRNHSAFVNKETCPWYKPDTRYCGTSSHTIWVTSTHHQMMRPGPSAQILLTACESTERHAAGEMQDGRVNAVAPLHQQDIEALWYPDTLSLCFQPHPEFRRCPPSGLWFFQQCMDNLILEAMPLPETLREILEDKKVK